MTATALTNTGLTNTVLRRRVRIVACAPLVWLVATLVSTFLLAPWWDLIGDVVVTWNVIGVFGLILTLPGALVVWIASSALHVRGDRWFAAGGFAILLTFCAWMITSSIYEIAAPPKQFDDPSMVPELTVAEQLIFTIPYVVVTIAIVWVLFALWRGVSSRESGANPNERGRTPRSSR